MSQKLLLAIVVAVVGIAAAVLLIAPGPEDKADLAPRAAAQPSTSEVDAAAGALSSGTQGGAAATLEVPQGINVQTPSDLVATPSVPPSPRVIATYFHNTARCVTCRNIEERSRGAIEAAFAAEIASGQLTWRALNMEKKENEHYAIDYDLPYASLVLAEVDGEREVRFRVLEETWDFIHKRQPLLETYVENETRAFLEGR